MPRAHRPRVRLPGFLELLSQKLRGQKQTLVRATAELPLLLLSYPPAGAEAAEVLAAAYAHTLPILPADVAASYTPTFKKLPSMVVIQLRRRGACDCLGHFHPPGTESPLARRLANEFGSSVGEIDLSYEGIRQWRPMPLAALAAGDLGKRLDDYHYAAALLTVLVHELEHLAFPGHAEKGIRQASNRFYEDVMRELAGSESPSGYGMSAQPRRL